MVTKIKDNNNIRLIIPAQVGARTSLEGKNVPGQESNLWRTIAASQTIPVQAEQEAARARPKPDHILEIEVAQALAQRAGIKNPPVVRSFNGVITLRGKIENEVALDAAEEVTLALPGVKGVINGLAVKAWNSASERENLAKNFRAGRQSFRFSGWNLPQGHIDIQEDAEVFASNGKLGRVRGLVFARSDMKVQYLIVDTGKFLFNAWHWLPFNYLEGSYFPHNPAIFLKINRAEFKEVSQSSERQDMNGCTGLVSICIFGKKMPIKYGSKKVGWLGGALLGPTGPDSFNLSYYLLKTDHSTRPLLLPGEALEAGANDSALYLKPDQQQVLLHPYRFNGFNPPESVVKRLLEKLAWSSVMQLRGGRLRVEYMEGEIFLKGVLPAKVSPEPLLSIAGSVPGVWRVHNLIVTKPTPIQIEQNNL